MADEIIDSVPSVEGQTPGSDNGSNSSSQNTAQGSFQVPDHLKGKTNEEVIQMYQNLEKKLGENSSEVSEARKLKKDMEVLVNAIYQDPERFKQASKWIDSYLGISTDEKNDTDTSKTGTQNEGKPQSDDTRKYLQDKSLVEFYQKHGIDKLPAEERKSYQSKIAQTLAELQDPGGTKSFSQIFDAIPVNKLSQYLDASYKVAFPDEYARRISSSSQLDEEENRFASIGSMGASSSGDTGRGLSAEEKFMAQKLGMSESEYLKNKPTPKK